MIMRVGLVNRIHGTFDRILLGKYIWESENGQKRVDLPKAWANPAEKPRHWKLKHTHTKIQGKKSRTGKYLCDKHVMGLM